MTNDESTPLNAKVALLLRRRREDLGLSQEELSHRAQLDRTYVSGVERGKRNVTLASLHRILVALEISDQRFGELLSSMKDEDATR